MITVNFSEIQGTCHTISNLTQPYWNYTVSIQAFTQDNGDGTNSTQTELAETAEGRKYNPWEIKVNIFIKYSNK